MRWLQGRHPSDADQTWGARPPAPPSRLRKGRTDPNPSGHVEYRDKEADAIALLECCSYHFALDIGNSYRYGDSSVVRSESAKYFLDDTINRRVSDCVEALVGLA